MPLPSLEVLLNLAAAPTKPTVPEGLRYAVALATDEHGHGWPAAELSSFCTSIEAVSVAEGFRGQFSCGGFSPTVDISMLPAAAEERQLRKELAHLRLSIGARGSDNILPILVFPAADAPTVVIGSGLLAWAKIPIGSDPGHATVRALVDVHAAVCARATTVLAAAEQHAQPVRRLSVTLAVEFDPTDGISGPVGWDNSVNPAEALVPLQSRLSDVLGIPLMAGTQIKREVVIATPRQRSAGLQQLSSAELEELFALGPNSQLVQSKAKLTAMRVCYLGAGEYLPFDAQQQWNFVIFVPASSRRPLVLPPTSSNTRGVETAAAVPSHGGILLLNDPEKCTCKPLTQNSDAYANFLVTHTVR